MMPGGSGVNLSMQMGPFHILLDEMEEGRGERKEGRGKREEGRGKGCENTCAFPGRENLPFHPPLQVVTE